MATTKDFLDLVLDSLGPEAGVRPMMGEYLLYWRGALVGDLCDNCLYLKITPASVRLLPDAERGYPYEGSRTLMLMADCIEDSARMHEILDAMLPELPLPACRKSKKKLP